FFVRHARLPMGLGNLFTTESIPQNVKDATPSLQENFRSYLALFFSVCPPEGAGSGSYLRRKSFPKCGPKVKTKASNPSLKEVAWPLLWRYCPLGVAFFLYRGTRPHPVTHATHPISVRAVSSRLAGA